jgi:hypothetical protein
MITYYRHFKYLFVTISGYVKIETTKPRRLFTIYLTIHKDKHQLKEEC